MDRNKWFTYLLMGTFSYMDNILCNLLWVFIFAAGMIKLNVLHIEDRYWKHTLRTDTENTYWGWILRTHIEDGYWEHTLRKDTENTYWGWILRIHIEDGYWEHILRTDTENTHWRKILRIHIEDGYWEHAHWHIKDAEICDRHKHAFMYWIVCTNIFFSQF